MPIRECQDSHTHREYQVWMCWLEKQWNKPSRSDHYLMRVAQRVLQSQSTKPQKVDLDDQKVSFTLVKKKTEEETVESKKEKSKYSKSIWTGLVNYHKSLKDRRKKKKNGDSN